MDATLLQGSKKGAVRSLRLLQPKGILVLPLGYSYLQICKGQGSNLTVAATLGSDEGVV